MYFHLRIKNINLTFVNKKKAIISKIVNNKEKYSVKPTIIVYRGRNNETL